MLCVPWVLERAEVCMSTPLFATCSTTSHEGTDTALECAKEDVGVFRIKHGDAKWREHADAVDTVVGLPRTITKPVSRAYFKLIEILRTCTIPAPRTSLHICEAPGGFVQAVLHEFASTTMAHVMSLRANGAPLISSTILHSDRVNCLDLQDSSNLLEARVRDQVVEEVRGADLVTADGAVDNDAQPQLAENATAMLIACEIETALRIQNMGGTFVLKIFSFSRPITKQLVAILTRCYETVSIVKPFTSRAVNDERYIVCQGFNGNAQFRAPSELLTSEAAYLESVATVNDKWMTEADQISRQLVRTQRDALRSALTYTSSRGASSRRTTSRAGRGGRMRGRGNHPYTNPARGPERR